LEFVSSGDVLFWDAGHHSFMNSDATVFYTELMPVLPTGMVYGVHDIFLPDDYPLQWYRRFYNEQYLMAAYLLGGARGDRIIFPSKYISKNAELCTRLAGIFDLPALADREPSGSAFWMARDVDLSGLGGGSAK